MKFKNRQQLLMALAIGAAGLYILVNFVFAPLQGFWADRQKEIHDLAEKVQDGRSKIAREQFIRQKWSDMQSNSLPASAQDAEQQFFRAMDGWARDSGAEITTIMPQWKNDSTNYMTMDCRVESSGDLAALSRFIYDIEKGPMPLRLDSVELSSHDNNGQQMTLGLEIDGLALLLQNNKK